MCVCVCVRVCVCMCVRVCIEIRPLKQSWEKIINHHQKGIIVTSDIHTYRDALTAR